MPDYDGGETLHDRFAEVVETAIVQTTGGFQKTVSEYTEDLLDRLPIQPGDLVEATDRDLDPRPVTATRLEGDELFITLNVGARDDPYETPWLPASRYQVLQRRGAW